MRLQRQDRNKILALWASKQLHPRCASVAERAKVHDWAPDEYEFVVKVMANKKPVLSLLFLFLLPYVFLVFYGFHFHYCSYLRASISSGAAGR
jgi:hypothetical protein